MAFNGYVQIPPDGTGKKIGHVILIELDYTGGTADFELGDKVIGATSGVEGYVVKISGTTSSGELYLSLDYESSVAFTIGENLQVDSVTRAQAASAGLTLYTPTVSIVDHENTLNGVNVTNEGELIISAAEGPFGFDSFGNLSVSQESYLGLYNYEYGINTYELNPQTSSLGLGETILAPTSINNLAWSGVTMTNPSTSGSVTRLESNLYHPYNAGTGQKWIGSVNCGDSGTAGVVRRWGYFDNEDGLFFELSGSTMLAVVRSSVPNGVIVENRIPQTEWNVDRLDGQGGDRNISTLDLDPSKGIVYFIDFQWLGVGRTRWGVITRGKRIVCHQIHHGGSVDYPYMRCGTLPARIEQINYRTAGSPTVMRNYSMAVIASSRYDPHTAQVQGQTSDLTRNVDWTGSFRPLMSVKSKPFFNGRENRSIAIPTRLSVYSTHNPLIIQIHKWPVLTGDTWTVPTSSISTLMGDYTATTASQGAVEGTFIIPANDVWEHEFPTEWDEAWKVYRAESIGNERCAFTLMGKQLNVTNAPSSSVTVTLNWKEIY